LVRQQMFNDAKSLGFRRTTTHHAVRRRFQRRRQPGQRAGGVARPASTTFAADSATAYAHAGVSMMNGRSDAGEYFRQADFQRWLDLPGPAHHLARYTYWSVNATASVGGSNQSTTSGTCSSVPQAAWEFTPLHTRFRRWTPPNPTHGATHDGATGTCTAAAWNASHRVHGWTDGSSLGHTGAPKWWTQGETPGSADVWVDQGACTGSTNRASGPVHRRGVVGHRSRTTGPVVSTGGHRGPRSGGRRARHSGQHSQAVWTTTAPV